MAALLVRDHEGLEMELRQAKRTIDRLCLRVDHARLQIDADRSTIQDLVAEEARLRALLHCAHVWLIKAGADASAALIRAGLTMLVAGLLLLGPAPTWAVTTEWTVVYEERYKGPFGTWPDHMVFRPTGTWMFLLGPGYIVVYEQDRGYQNRGLYDDGRSGLPAWGTAADIPDDMPAIHFTTPYDAAYATRILRSEPVTSAVPEPATVMLLATALPVLALGRTWWQMREQHGRRTHHE
jgi:hypothetical protein